MQKPGVYRVYDHRRRRYASKPIEGKKRARAERDNLNLRLGDQIDITKPAPPNQRFSIRRASPTS